MKPRIYADFIKKDEQGRLLLKSLGSLEDIAASGLRVGDRREVVFYSDDVDAAGQPDDLEAEGVVEWDNNLACWLGTFNSSNFRHHSENG